MTEDDTDNSKNSEAEDAPKKADEETSNLEAEAAQAAAVPVLDSAPPVVDANGDDSWSNLSKSDSAQDVQAVYDVPVRVSTVLGKSAMQVNEILRLGRGAVVELDRKIAEPVDVYVNERLVARGEVVVVDERLGIIMTEIIKTQKG
jgi:flagellar motor switch protein FliN/FliY